MIESNAIEGGANCPDSSIHRIGTAGNDNITSTEQSSNHVSVEEIEDEGPLCPMDTLESIPEVAKKAQNAGSAATGVDVTHQITGVEELQDDQGPLSPWGLNDGSDTKSGNTEAAASSRGLELSRDAGAGPEGPNAFGDACGAPQLKTPPVAASSRGLELSRDAGAGPEAPNAFGNACGAPKLKTPPSESNDSDEESMRVAIAVTEAATAGAATTGQSSTTGIAATCESADVSSSSLDLLEGIVQAQGEPLPFIPEAYAVEDGAGGTIVDAQPLIPWWKQKRIVGSLACFVVTTIAVAAALGISLGGGDKKDGSVDPPEKFFITSAPTRSTAPTESNVPTFASTPVPSQSLVPSVSPTACTSKLVADAQEIELPLANPSSTKFALEGNDMVVVTRDSLSGSVHVTFYSSANGEWEVKDTFDQGFDAVGGVALSSGSALLGFPLLGWSSGNVLSYARNTKGVWERKGSLLSLDADNFGSSIGIDANLACVMGQDYYYIFRIQGEEWEEVNRFSMEDESQWAPWSKCFVSGNTISALKFMEGSIELRMYDDGQKESVAVQDPLVIGPSRPDSMRSRYLRVFGTNSFGLSLEHPQRYLSMGLSGNHLVYSEGAHDDENNCYTPTGVFIYRREEQSQPFVLLQDLISSDYDGKDSCLAFGHELALDRDILVVAGGNKTYVFAEQNDRWEEALVLDQSFDSYQLSGRTLVVSTNNEMKSFNLADCGVQEMPTNLPSSSIAPSSTTVPSMSQPPSFSPTETCLAAEIFVARDDDPRPTKLEVKRGGWTKETEVFFEASRESHNTTMCLGKGEYEIEVIDHWGDRAITLNGTKVLELSYCMSSISTETLVHNNHGYIFSVDCDGSACDITQPEYCVGCC